MLKVCPFKIFNGVFLLFMTHSCVLYSPYKQPCIDLPETWRLPVDEASTTANLKWWEQLEDPVLNDFINEALQNNRDLKVAIARVYDFLAQYEIVRSQLFPQIYGSGGYSRQEVSEDTFALLPGSPRVTNLYSLFLNFSYQLDIWGQFRSETEAALQELYATIEARRTVVLTLVSAVASSYVTLRQYDKQLKVSKETQKSRFESYELAKLRFEGGLTSEMEVIQAESEAEDATIQVKELEIAQQQQENLLCILLGRNPGPLPRGPTLDSIVLPPQVPGGLPSEILEQRPDVLQAEHLLIASNANIGVARALYFPQISLTGMYGTEGVELRQLFRGPAEAWQYGVSFMQQIYNAGKIWNQVQLAFSQNLEALYAYEQTILTAFKEVDDALIALEKYKELVVVQHRQVEILREYLMLANLRFDNGQTDYLNVLDAERTLFRAELNYAQTQANALLSYIDIYKAVGGGWVLDADKSVNKCLRKD